MKRFILAFVLAAVLALPQAGAHAATTHSRHKKHEKVELQLIPVVPPLIATYDVYVGGLHLVTADVLFQEQDGHYHTLVNAHTYGFWAKHFPWQSTLDSVGLIRGDHFVPTTFVTVDDWKHHPKQTKLSFTPNGDVTPEFDPPNTDSNREFVTADQRRGSYDPVSGLLQMLAQVSVHDSCAATVPIFDGKRRFDLVGIDDRRENIDEADYSSFKGNARVCDVEFNMIAGEWKERDHIQNGFWQRDEGKQGREPFSIWLGSVGPGLPELPVRLQSGSVWGLIVMHLREWRYAGAAPTP